MYNLNNLKKCSSERLRSWWIKLVGKERKSKQDKKYEKKTLRVLSSRIINSKQWKEKYPKNPSIHCLSLGRLPKSLVQERDALQNAILGK